MSHISCVLGQKNAHIQGACHEVGILGASKTIFLLYYIMKQPSFNFLEALLEFQRKSLSALALQFSVMPKELHCLLFLRHMSI